MEVQLFDEFGHLLGQVLIRNGMERNLLTVNGRFFIYQNGRYIEATPQPVEPVFMEKLSGDR